MKTSTKKRALILGVGGQDGSYMADLLLEKGYEVHGLYRRSSVDNLVRIAHCHDRITLHRGDLADGASVEKVIVACQPDEIYNLADQDHVGFSKETPQVSIDITAGAVQRLLETVLRLNTSIRVFQAISATIFGKSQYLQNESTPLNPDSPYACAKACALHLCQYYRRRGLYVTTGIMTNHESPRRGPDYLLQRIIREARTIGDVYRPYKTGQVRVANPDMLVDIGYAPEFMDCAISLLQLENSDDYVIGTGVGYTIHELARYVLSGLGWTQPDKLIEAYTDSRFDNEPVLIADTDKLRTAIGRKPTTHGADLVKALGVTNSYTITVNTKR